MAPGGPFSESVLATGPLTTSLVELPVRQFPFSLSLGMIPDRSSPSRVPLRGFHQSAVAIGNQRVHGDAPVLVLVEQRDGSAKQPLHLISERGFAFSRCCRTRRAPA